MAKPTIGQPNWGDDLNDHLDTLASEIAGKASTADLAPLEAQGDLVFNVAKTPFSGTFDGAADVTDAIQSALDEAEAAIARADAFTEAEGTATVVLPPGWGKVTGLTISSKVRLRGQGDDTILMLTGGSNANVIQSKNYGDPVLYDRGIRVENMRIIGNKANQSPTLCPQTYVVTEAAVSTVPTTLTVTDTTGFDTTGRLWVGSSVVSYTGKTATTFTGVTIHAGADTLRKSTWVTPFASKGHLVAIQGANCHVQIYGDTAAGSGIYFQGPDPSASGGVIVPENTVHDGTRINSSTRYGLEVGQNASDGMIGLVVLGPNNAHGSLLVRAPNWKFNQLHVVGTFGTNVTPIPQALLIAADNFRGNTLYLDTFPGTSIVIDGTVQGGVFLDDIDIAQTRHFQCSYGAGSAGHGVLFRGIQGRTTMRGHRFAGLNMTAPIGIGYQNGPWARTVGSQDLSALVDDKLQIVNAADFAVSSDIGGPVTVGSEELTYTGRQMSLTKLTATAAVGAASITVASTDGFDTSGSITTLTEEFGTFTAQTLTYTGKTATTFTGIPAAGPGSIGTAILASGQRGQVAQHFLTGVSPGVATVADRTAVAQIDQTVLVQGMQISDPTFRGLQVQSFGMAPADDWHYVGGASGNRRLAQVEEADVLTTGEEVFDRQQVGSTSIAMTSGILRGAYFTARKTELITQVRMWTGAVAAGATPSLVRVGVWEANDDGSLGSLVASTTNDTALLSAINTQYTKSFAASFRKMRGRRYFVGLLVVTAATAPQMTGATFGAQGSIFGQSPVLGLGLGGQADLPATLSTGSVVPGVSRPYFVLLP